MKSISWECERARRYFAGFYERTCGLASSSCALLCITTLRTVTGCFGGNGGRWVFLPRTCCRGGQFSGAGDSWLWGFVRRATKEPAAMLWLLSCSYRRMLALLDWVCGEAHQAKVGRPWAKPLYYSVGRQVEVRLFGYLRLSSGLCSLEHARR